MVDRSDLVELAPHYVAMLALTVVALTAVRGFVALSFWQEFLVIVPVVFLYRPLVDRLGVAPSAWSERGR
jgi:hypothetical protein